MTAAADKPKRGTAPAGGMTAQQCRLEAARILVPFFYAQPMEDLLRRTNVLARFIELGDSGDRPEATV